MACKLCNGSHPTSTPLRPLLLPQDYARTAHGGAQRLPLHRQTPYMLCRCCNTNHLRPLLLLLHPVQSRPRFMPYLSYRTMSCCSAYCSWRSAALTTQHWQRLARRGLGKCGEYCEGGGQIVAHLLEAVLPRHVACQPLSWAQLCLASPAKAGGGWGGTQCGEGVEEEASPGRSCAPLS